MNRAPQFIIHENCPVRLRNVGSVAIVRHEVVRINVFPFAIGNVLHKPAHEFRFCLIEVALRWGGVLSQ